MDTLARSAASPGTAPGFSEQFTKSLRQESMLLEDRYREANCRVDFLQLTCRCELCDLESVYERVIPI
jgi:hypothetical protein